MNEQIPNDLDDSALALLAFSVNNSDFSDRYFYKIIDRKLPSGYYGTWLVSEEHPHFNDVDFTVNSLIYLLYVQNGLEDKSLNKLIKRVLKSRELTSEKSFYIDYKYAYLHLLRACEIKADNEMISLIKENLYKLSLINQNGFDSLDRLLLSYLDKSLLSNKNQINLNKINLKLTKYKPSIFCKDFPKKNKVTYSCSKGLSLAFDIEEQSIYLAVKAKAFILDDSSGRAFTKSLFSLARLLYKNITTKVTEDVLNSFVMNISMLYYLYDKYDQLIDDELYEEAKIHKSQINLEYLKFRNFINEISMLHSIDNSIVNSYLNTFISSLKNIESPNINNLSYIIIRMSPLTESVVFFLRLINQNEKSLIEIKNIIQIIFLYMQINDDFLDLHEDLKNKIPTYCTQYLQRKHGSKLQLKTKLSKILTKYRKSFYKSIDILKIEKGLNLYVLNAFVELAEKYYNPFGK